MATTADVKEIKEIFESGKLKTASGSVYQFHPMTHVKRRKVFAFFTKVGRAMEAGDFSFLDTKEWFEVEELISEFVTLDGMQLSKLPSHWEEHPEDYLEFVGKALGAISFPFLRGGLTG